MASSATGVGGLGEGCGSKMSSGEQPLLRLVLHVNMIWLHALMLREHDWR